MGRLLVFEVRTKSIACSGAVPPRKFLIACSGMSSIDTMGRLRENPLMSLADCLNCRQ